MNRLSPEVNRERSHDLVSISPLRFLLASGLLSDMGKAHPIVKTDGRGRFLKVEKINEKNFYEKSIAYQSWVEGSGPALTRYMNFEVANMWRSFNNQELTREFPLDPMIGLNGFLKRTVDGHEYRVAQMTPIVEIGHGWRMTDLMVVPTGGADMSLHKFPEYVRGYSPLVFYHPEMDRNGWKILGSLVNDFAGGLFSLARNTELDLSKRNGAEVSQRGGDGDEEILRRKSLTALISGNSGSADYLERGWEDVKTGSGVRTNAGLACELLSRARAGFIPIVDRVVLTSKRIADNFTRDYMRVSRIDPGKLELFSQLIMASWPGAMMEYFERYYNRPTADFVAGRKVYL